MERSIDPQKLLRNKMREKLFDGGWEERGGPDKKDIVCTRQMRWEIASPPGLTGEEAAAFLAQTRDAFMQHEFATMQCLLRDWACIGQFTLTPKITQERPGAPVMIVVTATMPQAEYENGIEAHRARGNLFEREHRRSAQPRAPRPLLNAPLVQALFSDFSRWTEEVVDGRAVRERRLPRHDLAPDTATLEKHILRAMDAAAIPAEAVSITTDRGLNHHGGVVVRVDAEAFNASRMSQVLQDQRRIELRGSTVR